MIQVRAMVALAAAMMLAAVASEGAGLRVEGPAGAVLTGQVRVEAELDSEAWQAELALDGEPVCSLSWQAPACTVDLGARPRVHCLEAVRRGPSGAAVERFQRWINRPGYEAGLEILRRSGAPGRPCSAELRWSHPQEREPATMSVSVDGNPLKVDEATWSVRFPCPAADNVQVVVASAVFGDGSRAEAVSVAGREHGLAPLVLELAGEEPLACDDGAFELAGTALVEPGRYEVVLVVDPAADFQAVLASGWTADPDAAAEETDATDAEPRPGPAWVRSEGSLEDAERLWFVVPDAHLARANGFSHGRAGWLRLLFGIAGLELEAPVRIADAVAAAGLVAGAGPRRRAVVLVLGDGGSGDSSRLSPADARSYLAEVGVPLLVLRTTPRRDDGWPAGLPNQDMEAMAENLDRLAAMLDRQCVAWFEGDADPAPQAQSWPAEVRRAGSVVEADDETALPPPVVSNTVAPPDEEPEAAYGHTMDVTAVSILVSAADVDSAAVTDLGVQDLEVFEDGTRVEVIGLDPIGLGMASVAADEAAEPGSEVLPRPAREVELPISIYVEDRLSDAMTLGPMLEQLMDEAELLVAVGPVEIVVAADGLETVLRQSRDAAEVRDGLRQVAELTGGSSQVEQIRRQFVRDIRATPRRLTREQARILQTNPDATAVGEAPGDNERSDFRMPTASRSHVKMAARSAAAQEERLVSSCLERLQRWALRFPGSRPRLLFMVGGSFDEDPSRFYLPFVEREEPHNAAELRTELEARRQGARVVRLADELAGAGWRILALAAHSTAGFSAAAESGEGARLQSFLSAAPEAVRSSDAGWLLLDPVASQRRLVAPGGGEVVVGGDALRTELDRIQGWYRLTYQLDRPADGSLHRIEVRSRRDGVLIRQPQVIASETSEAQARVRLLQALDDPASAGGSLAVRLKLGEVADLGERRASEIVASVDLGPILEVIQRSGAASIRVSVAVATRQNEPFVLHRVERLYGSGPGDVWFYTVPLEWPASGGRLAVVAEELSTGTWGVATLDLPE